MTSLCLPYVLLLMIYNILLHFVQAPEGSYISSFLACNFCKRCTYHVFFILNLQQRGKKNQNQSRKTRHAQSAKRHFPQLTSGEATSQPFVSQTLLVVFTAKLIQLLDYTFSKLAKQRNFILPFTVWKFLEFFCHYQFFT